VPDYDVLVDSPIEVGTHKVLEFSVQNIPHKIAMYGEGNYDEKRLVADMKAIVEEAVKIFNDIPYEHYTFIVHNLPIGGGGLEHLNSTTLQTSRWSYGTEAGYTGFLGLVAHEYFHLWNIKRIRPKVLGPFDYENENYTTLLWVAEGVTSYYDDLILRRAGLIDADEYLTIATGNIGTIENAPGSKVQSLAESSFDAWIKYYRPNENSNNTSISYYTKGAIIGMLLDLEIMYATQGKRSFDDVLKYLYEEYYKKQKRGFTEAEMQGAVEKIAGKKLNDFFQKHVYDVQPIDYNKYLGYVGLKLVNYSENRNEPYLGAATSYVNGKVTVTSVMRSTAAYQYGLNVNDEIIAVDNYRITDDLLRIIAMKKVGDKITILINRAGIIQNLEVMLGKNPNASYGIQRVASATPQQEALLQQWLKL
jgi:predicted metalloprotease with PDZ domain